MKIFHVDSFTKERFKGNPAAVCILKNDIDELLMQQIAAEMNLSETAFVRQKSKSTQLRWFTPKVEVDLCGHATLAAAHILWEQELVKKNKKIHFETKSGTLIIERLKKGLIQMDFPAITAEKTAIPKELQKAIPSTIIDCFKTEKIYILELEDPSEVANLVPDFAGIKSFGYKVIVTAKGTEKYDFISRFFAPTIGIDEDPVTGAAHCALTPYWAQKIQKDTYKAYQASARGGELQLQLKDDRVLIVGRAVTTLKGKLVL